MINPTEGTLDGSNTIWSRRLNFFLEHVHLQEKQSRPPEAPSPNGEDAARVELHVNTGIVAVCARSTYINNRRNRSVLLSMVAGVSMTDAHSGSFWHVVWLQL
jgi:hypothetical protein